MSRKKKTGCVASFGTYHGVDYLCEAKSFRVDENYDYLPPTNCDYAVKSKSSDYCRFIWKLPNGEPGYDGTCHCAEAKKQALDILYKETMKLIGKEQYKLLASWMRTRSRREERKQECPKT